jgi:hypothetical protein
MILELYSSSYWYPSNSMAELPLNVGRILLKKRASNGHELAHTEASPGTVAKDGYFPIPSALVAAFVTKSVSFG